MSERADSAFLGGVYTKKRMPNGEVRTRIRLNEGPVHSFSTTVMNEWNWADGAPWQEAHFHKGLTEHYMVYKGWVVFGEKNPNYGEDRYARTHHGFVVVPRPKQVITFGPDEPHVVLLGPGAVIGTLISGDPIVNPEKNNHDWWPAEEGMNQWVSRWPIEELKLDIFEVEGKERPRVWPFP